MSPRRWHDGRKEAASGGDCYRYDSKVATLTLCDDSLIILVYSAKDLQAHKKGGKFMKSS